MVKAMKPELMKSRKQVRVYLDEKGTESLAKVVSLTELPETTICNALVHAGLAALEKGGFTIQLPLRFKVDDTKKPHHS